MAILQSLLCDITQVFSSQSCFLFPPGLIVAFGLLRSLHPLIHIIYGYNVYKIYCLNWCICVYMSIMLPRIAITQSWNVNACNEFLVILIMECSSAYMGTCILTGALNDISNCINSHCKRMLVENINCQNRYMVIWYTHVYKSNIFLLIKDRLYRCNRTHTQTQSWNVSVCITVNHTHIESWVHFLCYISSVICVMVQ